MNSYIIGSLVIALAGTGAWGVMERKRALRATVELTQTAVSLRTCAVQIADIREDLESDNAIDALDNSDLIDVPPGWLLGDPDAD